MKLYEFLNNAETLNTIEGLIYFDNKWMFPEYNLREFMNIDNFEFFNKLAKKIVDELNKRKIEPVNYNNDVFLNIVNDLTF
jgi:hypothetical protein